MFSYRDNLTSLLYHNLNGATKLSMTTFRVTTLSIKGVYVTLSVTMFCHYAECRVLFIVILNVVRLIVFSLNVVAPIISQMEIFLVPVPLLGAMTLSIMALSITTFSIMTLSIKGLCITLSINYTQHNDALP